MSTQADVKSLDTLSFVKAALASYAHETGQAIAEVELEGRQHQAQIESVFPIEILVAWWLSSLRLNSRQRIPPQRQDFRSSTSAYPLRPCHCQGRGIVVARAPDPWLA